MIGLDNGLSFGLHQAIILTNAEIFVIRNKPVKCQLKFIHSGKYIWKSHLRKGGHIVSASC